MRNLLIVFLVVSGYLATGLEVTVPDYLKYRGEVYMVNSEPLAIFLMNSQNLVRSQIWFYLEKISTMRLILLSIKNNCF